MIMSRKKRAAQVNTMLVGIILALILLGIGIYLAYTYVFTSGENIGALGECASQKGTCSSKNIVDGNRCFKGLGCTAEKGGAFCCIPT
jgi:hypothetical protein